jgi:hypothetical protein
MSNKKYSLYKIFGALPLEEFRQGNFSQATTIAELYYTFIEQCTHEAIRKHTGGLMAM